ncbi:unnamed protein product [Owenia fusiformis]|uniref:Uncharacterized protein n=1 Tax=Owenia fusiformis TaxID=6347 RepID=A0A8J1TVQ5_OWEFU|nr:unnamed protein product [Owenia fusiformis]
MEIEQLTITTGADIEQLDKTSTSGIKQSNTTAATEIKQANITTTTEIEQPNITATAEIKQPNTTAATEIKQPNITTTTEIEQPNSTIAQVIDEQTTVSNSEHMRDMEFFAQFNYYFNFWIQALLRIFGIIGNIFNLIILSRPEFKAKNSYNILLLSLAVADMITLIIGLPLNILIENSMFLHKSVSFEWQVYMYYGLFTVGYMSISAGNWTTTMVSIQRYIAICMPLKCNRLCSSKRTRIVTVTIWLLSIILFTENYLNYSVEYVTEGNSTYPKFVKGILRWPLYDSIMNNVQIALCSYVPWFISFCAIIRIGTELSLKTTEQDILRSTKEPGQQQEVKITAMLTSIVFVYLICSIPTSVRYIVRSTVTVPVYYSQGVPYMVLDGLANFGIAFNSAINIVLYSVTSPKYRRIFISIICPCYTTRRSLDSSTSNMRSNETGMSSTASVDQIALGQTSMDQKGLDKNRQV